MASPSLPPVRVKWSKREDRYIADPDDLAAFVRAINAHDAAPERAAAESERALREIETPRAPETVDAELERAAAEPPREDEGPSQDAIGMMIEDGYLAGFKESAAKVAAEARRYASHYPQSSDGRNTFILLAEWAERQVPADPPTPPAGETAPTPALRQAVPAMDMQGHRDAWREYAYGNRAKPSDFLDGGNKMDRGETLIDRLTAKLQQTKERAQQACSDRDLAHERLGTANAENARLTREMERRNGKPDWAAYEALERERDEARRDALLAAEKVARDHLQRVKKMPSGVSAYGEVELVGDQIALLHNHPPTDLARIQEQRR